MRTLADAWRYLVTLRAERETQNERASYANRLRSKDELDFAVLSLGAAFDAVGVQAGKINGKTAKRCSSTMTFFGLVSGSGGRSPGNLMSVPIYTCIGHC
jgi:hypothetical protein